MLKARLAQATAESRPSFWQRLPRFAVSGFDTGVRLRDSRCCCAVGLDIQPLPRARSPRRIAQVEPVAIPKPELTPGAVRLVTARTRFAKCSLMTTMGSIPVPVQQKVFQEYGIPNARPADYEVDYLITPELGGATDIRNLWPEPHSSTAWNSYVKDDLENRLHQLVCDGQVALPVAQHDIATNWISAYKKYFHTDRPVTRRTQLTARQHPNPRLACRFISASLTKIVGQRTRAASSEARIRSS